MYRRVVPGLPVMMALGNALSDAARKQNQQAHPKSSDPDGAGSPDAGTLRHSASSPATRAA